jgi:hypothetical protein
VSFSARDLFEVLYTSHCGYKRSLILLDKREVLSSNDEKDNILDLVPHPLDAIEGIKFESQLVKQIGKLAKELDIAKTTKITQEEFQAQKVPTRDGLYISQVEIDVQIDNISMPLHLKGDICMSKGGYWHIFEVKSYWALRSSINRLMLSEAIFQGSLYVLGLKQAGFAVSDQVNIVTRDMSSKALIASFRQESDVILKRTRLIPSFMNPENAKKNLVLSKCASSCPNLYRCLEEEEAQLTLLGET